MQRRAIRFLTHWLPLLIWLGFIFFASTGQFSANNTSRIVGPLVLWLFPNTSAETMRIIHGITRKLAHFTEYALLSFLAARAFRTSSNSLLHQHWFLISLVLVVVYALLDEYHQSFVPSRTASVVDSLIDMAGGLTILLVLRRRNKANGVA
jgi:VanZ family protein